MNRRIFVFGSAAATLLPRSIRAQDLDALLGPVITQVPGTVGVCARTLQATPPIFSYNPNESFPAASTIKMLIMLAAFRAQERSPGAMQEVVTIRRSDLVGGSDFLAGAHGGERYTVAQLLRPMITVSDNSAANSLISHLGFEAINASAARAGLLHTHLRRHFLDYSAIVHHHENVTTPADMAKLLYEIERGQREAMATVASPESCRQMISIMLAQTDRDKIPAGLPSGVAVANKTGEVDGVRNDVAIVDPFGDSPYVLTVLTKNLSSYAAAIRAINRISADVYRQVRGSGL